MNPIIVMAAVIERDGKILITQRPENIHNGLRWEFPGGKVDFGEDPRQALEREIKEELDITVEAGDVFELSSFVYEGKKHIVLLACNCDYVSGEIKKKGIKDFAWIKSEDLSDYDMTEADLPFVRKLLEIQ